MYYNCGFERKISIVNKQFCTRQTVARNAERACHIVYLQTSRKLMTQLWQKYLYCDLIEFGIRQSRNQGGKWIFFFSAFTDLTLCPVLIQKYFWHYESPWMNNQPEGLYLLEQRNTETRGRTSVPWMGFEPTIPVWERPAPRFRPRCHAIAVLAASNDFCLKKQCVLKPV